MSIDSKSEETFKIMLVDDDRFIMNLSQTQMKNMLKKYNVERYEILTAMSGEEAIKVYEANSSVKLISMDFQMPPGISGPETAKKIREFERERQIPPTVIVGVTGFSN